MRARRGVSRNGCVRRHRRTLDDRDRRDTTGGLRGGSRGGGVTTEGDEQVDVVALALNLDLVVVRLEERRLAGAGRAGSALAIAPAEVAERRLYVERVGRDQADVGGGASTRRGRVDQGHLKGGAVLPVEQAFAYLAGGLAHMTRK